MPDSVRVRLTIPTGVDDPRTMVGKMHEVMVRPLWPGSRTHPHRVDLWIAEVETQEDGTPLAHGVAHFLAGALEAAIPGDHFQVIGAHVNEAVSATGTILTFQDRRSAPANPGQRSLEQRDAMVTFRRGQGAPTYVKVPAGSGVLVGLESMRTTVRGELTFEGGRFHRGRMWFRLRLPAPGFAGSAAGDQIEVLDCPAAPWLVGADGRIELILENEGP